MTQQTNASQNQQARNARMLRKLLELEKYFLSFSEMQDVLRECIFLLTQSLDENTDLEKIKGATGSLKTLAEFFRDLENIEAAS